MSIKKFSSLLTILLVLFLFVGCSSAETTASDKNAQSNGLQSASSVPDDADSTTVTGDVTAVIEIEDYGTIKAELNADAAPITVSNFVKLSEEGFYNGLTFHRIMEGFMMQGGCPEGTGYGGSDQNIKGEFLANGVNNTLSHTRGALSMARSQSYDSASSQFFIVHEDSTFLDGSYAVFGYVTEGIEVVDKVCTEAKPTDDNGTIPKKAQPVIKSIKIIK